VVRGGMSRISGGRNYYFTSRPKGQEHNMRYLIALVALIGFLGFTTFVRAADPDTNYKNASKTGVFEKVDGKNIIYKGGAKGTGKEWSLVTSDSTKVTIDGKDAMLSELKPGQQLKLTIASKDGLVTKIEATTPKSK
jgi:hypothetical protein